MPVDCKAFTGRQDPDGELDLPRHGGITCGCTIDWIMFFNLERYRTI
jgi:hypothetical protein